MSLRKAFSRRRFSSRSACANSEHPSPYLESLLQRQGGLQGGEEEKEGEKGGDHGHSQNSEDCWSNMLPEILVDIIERIESREERWPLRKDVVACACVCRSWREITKSIVKSPQRGGKITFPSCLKQPGPRDLPIQCFIERNKNNSTFYLYLGLNSTSSEDGKFLLAARRFRHGAHIEYIISLDVNDLSQGGNAYIGKLSSDILGTTFRIYDSQPPYNGAKPSNSRSSRRFASKQICPQNPAGSFEIGQVSYKFNLFRSRGPRRMLCSLHCPLAVATNDDRQNSKPGSSSTVPTRWVVMKNKAPRWHEHLQCWCLNFHGRVTVASIKNFQLVATVDPSQPGAIGDEEVVLLQFGKVGDNLFTMDYRQPLSAFQAFAICLTTFGMKLACE